MNRHERRKAFAAGKRAAKTGSFPPLYGETCETMAMAYRMWREQYPSAAPPRFALPSPEVGLIGALDELVPRVARNQSARDLAELLCLAATMLGGPENVPTIFMLQGVLEAVGVDIERVSLAELGIIPMGGEQGRNN